MTTNTEVLGPGTPLIERYAHGGEGVAVSRHIEPGIDITHANGTTVIYDYLEKQLVQQIPAGQQDQFSPGDKYATDFVIIDESGTKGSFIRVPQELHGEVKSYTFQLTGPGSYAVTGRYTGRKKEVWAPPVQNATVVMARRYRFRQEINDELAADTPPGQLGSARNIYDTITKTITAYDGGSPSAVPQPRQVRKGFFASFGIAKTR